MSELAIGITIIGLTGVTLLTRARFLLLPQRFAPPRAFNAPCATRPRARWLPLSFPT